MSRAWVVAELLDDVIDQALALPHDLGDEVLTAAYLRLEEIVTRRAERQAQQVARGYVQRITKEGL